MTKFSKRKILAGLALGSGGAKGSALIGAIKAFEEDEIYFDVFRRYGELSDRVRF